MKKVLAIEVSPNGDLSASRQVSRYLLKKIKSQHTGSKAQLRDLSLAPPPHVDSLMVGAYFTPPDQRSEAQKKAVLFSDELVDELEAADVLVVSTPMWNFSLPSSLKAWVDHVIRAGRTFSFGASGPVGLLRGKKVFVVVSSGSVFSEGAYQAYDQLIPTLKSALGFIGLSDIEVIRVEGTNDPVARERALAKAYSTVDQLAV